MKEKLAEKGIKLVILNIYKHLNKNVHIIRRGKRKEKRQNRTKWMDPFQRMKNTIQKFKNVLDGTNSICDTEENT